MMDCANSSRAALDRTLVSVFVPNEELLALPRLAGVNRRRKSSEAPASPPRSRSCRKAPSFLFSLLVRYPLHQFFFAAVWGTFNIFSPT